MEGQMTRPGMTQDGQMLTNEQGKRRFIATMHAFDWFGTIEDAKEAWEQVLSCAEEKGFEIMNADIGNSREREPSESFSWGSTAPYQNTLATTALSGGMAGDMTAGKTGAEAHTGS